MVYVSQHVARGGAELSARFSRARLAYLGLRFGERWAPLLSRRVAYSLADRGGDLWYLADRAARQAVAANLTQVLGRPPSRMQVRRVFRHGSRNYYDTLIIPRLGRRELLELVEVDDWSPLERALRGGRGAILVGAHLSSVALTGQTVAAKGYRVTSATERLEPPELNELLLRLRGAGGIRVLPLGRQLVAELLAALGRNEVVGLVMDRDVAGTGVLVDFFGAPAVLPAGAALLALRSGAPMLPAAAVRVDRGRFRGWIAPPIGVCRGEDARESVRLTTQRIASGLESLIGPNFEQWTVFQPIWRRPATARDAP